MTSETCKPACLFNKRPRKVLNDQASGKTLEKNIKAELSNCQSARSSRPEVFCKKGVLRNFAKFTGKHLCQSLFLNKVAGLRPEIFTKGKKYLPSR